MQYSFYPGFCFMFFYRVNFPVNCTSICFLPVSDCCLLCTQTQNLMGISWYNARVAWRKMGCCNYASSSLALITNERQSISVNVCCTVQYPLHGDGVWIEYVWLRNQKCEESMHIAHIHHCTSEKKNCHQFYGVKIIFPLEQQVNMHKYQTASLCMGWLCDQTFCNLHLTKNNLMHVKAVEKSWISILCTMSKWL